MTTREHGSTAGYHQHRTAGEDACQQCLDAWAAYIREYRTKSPRTKAQAARRQLARSRADQKLKNAHPDEYDALYVDELRNIDATQDGRAGAPIKRGA
jgi:hypothetical protein